MSEKPNPGKDAGRPVAINEAAIQGRILKNALTVADWAIARLVRDASSSGIIPELYADYQSYCRCERRPPLPRKVWIAAMKLAGFETQAGAFVELAIQ